MKDVYRTRWMQFDTKRMLLQPYCKPQEHGARNRAELLHYKAKKALYKRGVVISPSILLDLIRAVVGKDCYNVIDMAHDGIDISNILEPKETQ